MLNATLCPSLIHLYADIGVHGNNWLFTLYTGWGLAYKQLSTNEQKNLKPYILLTDNNTSNGCTGKDKTIINQQNQDNAQE